MTAVAAECPAPTTTVCPPANGSGAAKSGIWYLTRPRPAAARSPRAGRPSAPAGFGCRHVPDASMTARACSLSSSPVLAADVHGERLVTPPGVDQAVAALSGHPGHPGPVPDPAAERVRQRAQVPGDPLGPGRVAPAGRCPARRARAAVPRPCRPVRATARTAGRAPTRPPQTRGRRRPRSPAAQSRAQAGARRRRAPAGRHRSPQRAVRSSRNPPIQFSRCIDYARCIEKSQSDR